MRQNLSVLHRICLSVGLALGLKVNTFDRISFIILICLTFCHYVVHRHVSEAIDLVRLSFFWCIPEARGENIRPTLTFLCLLT